MCCVGQVLVGLIFWIIMGSLGLDAVSSALGWVDGIFRLTISDKLA